MVNVLRASKSGKVRVGDLALALHSCSSPSPCTSPALLIQPCTLALAVALVVILALLPYLLHRILSYPVLSYLLYLLQPHIQSQPQHSLLPYLLYRILSNLIQCNAIQPNPIISHHILSSHILSSLPGNPRALCGGQPFESRSNHPGI